MISKEEFLRFKDEGYNIIPLVKSIYLNEDTPLCIYSKISDIGIVGTDLKVDGVLDNPVELKRVKDIVSKIS